MLLEKQLRLEQPAAIGGPLQIQMNRIPRARDSRRQRGLAALARAQDGRARKKRETLNRFVFQGARNICLHYESCCFKMQNMTFRAARVESELI